MSKLIAVESWTDYVKRIVGNATQQQIEKKTGIPSSNISRWLGGDPSRPKADNAVAFARAYNQSPIEALVAAGYITLAEAAPDKRFKTPLSEYSQLELFEELRSRMGD